MKIVYHKAFGIVSLTIIIRKKRSQSLLLSCLILIQSLKSFIYIVYDYSLLEKYMDGPNVNV